MYNASYLIRSRHAIYYFRYPLPQHDNRRVSISLKTRCPKEALRLSKALEYHATMVMGDPKVKALDYVEVKEILRGHFADLLERMKRRIDQDGALPEPRVQALLAVQADAQAAIDRNSDEVYDYASSDAEVLRELGLDSALQPIAARHGISLDGQSREHAALRREYKHALKGYVEALLSYNDSTGYYDYSSPAAVPAKAASLRKRAELTLENIISKYLDEDTDKDRRGFRDKQDSVNYLIEVFGGDYLITDVDHPEVRQVKDMLVCTPSNRNRKPATRDLPLERQIEIGKERNLDLFKDTNVNKYLGYMSGLFKWAVQNKYVSENPFEGVKVKLNKAAVRRVAFKKDEVRHILDAASQIGTRKALDKTRYWALLLYVYTGARLNEIASLNRGFSRA